ncbi:MAG: type II toxin-antitoxin system prevent-host-death family antitoxin [Acidobacteria bacterium]|nr:type II toxin-antitoxin system prevent-host-death family antitoxin [Acidobacteriota bacterium]
MQRRDSSSQANLSEAIDRACDDRARASVMPSERNHERLDATTYLLRSPANARRLLESVEEIEAPGAR